MARVESTSDEEKAKGVHTPPKNGLKDKNGPILAKKQMHGKASRKASLKEEEKEKVRKENSMEKVLLKPMLAKARRKENSKARKPMHLQTKPVLLLHQTLVPAMVGVRNGKQMTGRMIPGGRMRAGGLIPIRVLM